MPFHLISASQFPEGLWLGGKNLSFPREKPCRAEKSWYSEEAGKEENLLCVPPVC